MSEVNKQERGRSMVEILGVLAVVGVLSAGGISGYRYAMNKHHANEIIHGVSMMAMTASQQLIIHGDFSLNEFGENVAGYVYTFDTDHSKQDDDFSITIKGVSVGVCEQIMSMEWTLPYEIEINGDIYAECGDENDMSFVFMDDLGGYWEEHKIGYCGLRNCIACQVDETPVCTSENSSSGRSSCICIPSGETGICGHNACISCPAGEIPKCSMAGDGENACICAPETGNSACGDYACIVCPTGQKAKCAEMGTGENACLCEAEDETVVCGWHECFLVPEGKSAKCAYASDICITCPAGETAICTIYQSSSKNACTCVKEGEKGACGRGSCISCPAGETPRCSENGHEENACVCVPDGNDVACKQRACFTCAPDETLTCSASGANEGACVCVKEGETALCSDKVCISCQEGETSVCSTSGTGSKACVCVAEGETSKCGNKACISCPAGETAKCSTNGEGENACICIPEGKTGVCGDKACITCPAGETAKCSRGEPCICVPTGETGACGGSDCITCPAGETPKCSSNSKTCICVPADEKGTCNSFGNCISCPAGETPKCPVYGSSSDTACVCIKEGETSACSEYDCISCPAGETPKCSTYYDCLCEAEGETVKCGKYDCIIVPEGETGACGGVCISCPAGETPKCSSSGDRENACVCVKKGETVLCNDRACTSCPPDKTPVCKEYGCTCYDEGKCEAGQLMGNDASCISCDTDGAILTSSDECARCSGTDSPRVFVLGSCYLDCRTSETPIMNSSGTCVACDSTTAIATDEGNCSACDGTDTPRVMKDGKCVLKNCPVVEGENYVQLSTGACVKCSAAIIRNADSAHLETCRAAGYPRFTNAAGTISYLCTRAGISSSNAGVCHACNFEGTTSYRFMGTNGYCYPCSQTGSVATTAEECAQCGAMRTYDSSAKTCLLAS